MGIKSLGNAPAVQVSARGSNADVTLNVLPDSGAYITAAGENILAYLGEHVDNLLLAPTKLLFR